MFRAKTVVVIGAGASAEFGLPLGGALLQDIARRINISYDSVGRLASGDFIIADALRSALDAKTDVTLYNKHLHSACQLVKSSKQGLSIDNVLDALEDERASKVGKFGIVRSILEAEASSDLSEWDDRFPDKINVEAFSRTWLDQFTKLLTEGRKKSEIGSIFDNLSVINFNYDRVVEHYIPFSIANYYGLKPAVIRDVMPSLPIFRPYGKAGVLPWEGKEGSVAFGRCSARDIEVAASQILTFTEQVQDKDLVLGIQNAIQSADRIVFLGFGYHRQNLALLSAQACPHVEIRGTSFGMSDSDAKAVSFELKDIFKLKGNMIFKDHSYATLLPLESAAFVSEIWRTLTSGPGEDPTFEMPAMPNIRMPDFPRFGLR